MELSLPISISNRDNKEVHHKDQARVHKWRLTDDALEVGTESPTGEFEREGMSRPFHVANDWTLTGIDRWTRVENAK